MELLNLLVTLLSGAAGGNIAGSALPEKSMGSLWNSVVGLLGGSAGNYLLHALGILASAAAKTGEVADATAVHASGLDIGSILANVGTSGVSGAIAMAVVGYLKSALNKS